MTRAARLIFAVLVLATFGAFVVTQKLKSTPPLVVRPHIDSVFSPTPGARVRRAKISFWILHGDLVTVAIVDADGRIVRTLLDGAQLPSHRRIARFWDGRTSDGSVAPDGRYTVRVALIHQGRTIDLQQTIALDTTPPRPRVTSVEPAGRSGPAFLPQRGVHAVTVHLRGTEGRRARLLIYRTDVTPPREVGQLGIPPHRDTVTWDGRIAGRLAPPGTYLMGLLVADRSGNRGTFPATLPPVAGRVAGRAGVTIRHLAAAPPLTPVKPGGHATVLVDARGHRYDWALRRYGAGKVLAHGRGRGARLRVRVPHGGPGLAVLTLVAGAYRTEVPLVIGSARSHSVLVVLPALTWQGLNPVDDDGDGMPNTLAAGARVDLTRPFAHGLPGSLHDHEAALLGFLDGQLQRYELTTDAALATGSGPALAGHRGVVLAGDERWVTPQLRALLRRYVEGGGRVWSLGVDALRRSAPLHDGTLGPPSPPRLTDALGGRPRQPLVRSGQPATMTAYQLGTLGLFAQTSGAFAGYDVYETLAAPAPPAKLDAAAGPEAGTPVIAAWKLGDGVVVHTGLPQLAARAAHGDLDAQALVQRIWALLASG
jgi:FlgD Ig-like domain